MRFPILWIVVACRLYICTHHRHFQTTKYSETETNELNAGELFVFNIVLLHILVCIAQSPEVESSRVESCISHAVGIPVFCCTRIATTYKHTIGGGQGMLCECSPSIGSVCTSMFESYEIPLWPLSARNRSEYGKWKKIGWNAGETERIVMLGNGWWWQRQSPSPSPR